MQPGLRVLRCGEWKFGDQDGGEGHVGTVCVLEKVPKETMPNGMVFIVWDSGTVANYWYDSDDETNLFDLRVLDNAQTGTRHVFVTCDVCGSSGMIGMRWHCTQCDDFDLCTDCYMTDKHDTSHVFVRFDTPVSFGVQVPPRENSPKMEVHGIFVGARVMRGINWNWGNQDGGAGNSGVVREISGRDDSWRSILDVHWDNGGSNRYRLGFEGKADVQATTPASGGTFYWGHLPKLRNYAPSPNGLHVGDRVRIEEDAGTLERLQRERDDWDENYLQFLGKTGSVVTLRKDADVSVYFEYCKKMATFNYKALTKVPKTKTGDTVQILDSMEQVQQLQNDHGGWVNSMEETLGKKGKVVRVFDTGDLRVAVRGAGTWTFNPECCKLVSGDAADGKDAEDTSSDEESEGTVEVSLPVESLTSMGDQFLRRLLARDDGKSAGDMKVFDPENLVHQAERGDIFIVQQIVRDHPEKVSEMINGRLPIHIAAAKGNNDVIKILLEAGADVNAVDSDGDTALHFAVYGDRADTMEYLIQSGADVNRRNKKKHTALQIAVIKPSKRCAASLLQMETCEVNLQDEDGDTILHDAVFRGNSDVVNMIVECPRVDFTLTNKKTFTVLHQAAFKGNASGVHRLLVCDTIKNLVDVGTADGHTALHIAAVNGYREIAQALVEIGKADLNALNKHRHTPLMLALSEGHAAVIEFLVSKGADLSIADINGVSALHMALCDHSTVDLSTFPKLRKSVPKALEQAPAIAKICLELPSGLTDKPWIGIACYLLEHGADLGHVDRRGNSPISHIKNPVIIELLQKYASLATAKECMMCGDNEAVITFQPCGHRIVCYECSVRMKKCFLCHEPIATKIDQRLESSTPSPTAVVTGNEISSSVDADDSSLSAFGDLQSELRRVLELHEASVAAAGVGAGAGTNGPVRQQSQGSRKASLPLSPSKKSDDNCLLS